jgi:hypothetical protein
MLLFVHLMQEATGTATALYGGRLAAYTCVLTRDFAIHRKGRLLGI